MAKHQVIDSLAEKVGRVIEENTRLKKECAALGAEKEALRAENRRLQESVGQLKHKISLMELSKGMGGNLSEESKKRARAQINQLMREIDRCIALVNK